MFDTLRETFVQKHCTILAFENDQRITQHKDHAATISSVYYSDKCQINFWKTISSWTR